MVIIHQQQFLGNFHNKSRLISKICEKFAAANILVKQAHNDADVLSIETAIQQFSSTNITIVVGEDGYLLITLIVRTPCDKISVFFKSGNSMRHGILRI